MPYLQKTQTYLLANEHLPKTLLHSQANELTAWTPTGLPNCPWTQPSTPTLTLYPHAYPVTCYSMCFPELQFLCYSQINSISGHLSFPPFTLFRLTHGVL